MAACRLPLDQDVSDFLYPEIGPLHALLSTSLDAGPLPLLSDKGKKVSLKDPRERAEGSSGSPGATCWS